MDPKKIESEPKLFSNTTSFLCFFTSCKIKIVAFARDYEIRVWKTVAGARAIIARCNLRAMIASIRFLQYVERERSKLLSY